MTLTGVAGTTDVLCQYGGDAMHGNRGVEKADITKQGEDHPHISQVQQDQALCLLMHYTTRTDETAKHAIKDNSRRSEE
jgi:hypothetical protein